jgi:NAD(P)-dependent dehydrogenase (short-subunit alcohol dehydrogenase family)
VGKGLQTNARLDEMMKFDLSGKVIVVTGGFGALGRVTADMLSGQGAKVALLDLSAAPISPPPSHAGSLSIGGVNLQDSESTRNAFSQVHTHFGCIDGLVNIAGGYRWEELEGGQIATWDLLYGMNVRTAVIASQTALPYLLSRSTGRIVNVGSLSAVHAGQGMGAYAASKAGVAKITESLADELKDRAITVNAVLPGILDTPANRADMPKADFTRWVSLKALADVIVFLLSDAAGAVTGALIPVRGRM